MSEYGTWRRVSREGRRFLRGRIRTLGRLALWSLLESAHTFLGGYAVARALDDGFLAGRTGTGIGWLAVAGAGALLGALALRGVFGGLADLVEPLRDGLVRRSVRQAIGRAVADPGRAGDSGAVSRLTQQTEMARDSFAGLVLVARSFVFTALGALLGLAALAPVLLVLVLPALLLGTAAFLTTLRPMARVQRAALDADEALSARTGELAAGLRDVLACGGGAGAGAGVESLIAEQEGLTGRLARWTALRTLALGVAGRLPVVVLLAGTPWLTGRGVSAGAVAGALTYLVQSLLPALDALMTAVGAAGTRLLVVLDRFCDPRPAPRPASEAPAQGPGPEAAPPAPPAQLAPPAPAVELRRVRFAYGPRAQPVIDGLDLVVRPGEHLAVVGPSGIGKSTLTALIAGLLPPGRGSVRVAGAPAGALADVPAGHGGGPGPGPDVRRTLLPQQAYVFTGTVLDNLTHLSPGPVPRGEVERATAALGSDALVARLGGLDAAVDPARLTPGERQHLALAAAFLSPAPLLLLDEATCHLDPRAEEHAERALARRPGTLVVVAHRISSAARADRVLVLDGTRAVCGTHAELPARSALYRELVGLWDAPE
ncbi:ABC transporter ATP-binding protein [Streptomyces venezuelae]|uniref:ABC transporter ATP-binding protein n=1 Tax=Streptomyces venezuelae TaxID=54571 RepID=A0A5P2DUH2_STRVZ|nr:ABC transporter ATP-binding protein [Streptomyces venezuelae]QES58180.1 ABC transporter ATP-binding protein [Streptomyces venezuelae]